MKVRFLLFFASLLLFSSGLALAQNLPDSAIKEMSLKEVHIHTIRKSKHPGTAFYQSSALSSTEDILSRVEGVSLIRRGPIGMEPVLRAFSGGQLNVVIDGMKIFGACTDKMDPATIYTEPVNLKSIDVRHGGEGMAMGAAIGGTLNLKLADAAIDPERRFSGSLASGYYSAAQAVQNVVAMNYSANKWALRLSGVYRKAGNYRNGRNQKTEFSQYEKANISLSGKYQLDKNSTLKADLLWDDGWNIGYPALPMDVGYAKARIAALTYRKEDAHAFIKLLEAKVYANGIRHAMDDTKRPQVAMHMDMPGQSHTQGVFAQFQLRAIGKHQLLVKSDLYHNFVKADMTMYPPGAAPMYMLTWPENHQTVAGLFIQDELTLNNKSRIDFKLRTDMAFSKLRDEMGQNQFAVLGYDVTRPKNQLLKNISVGFTRYLNPLFTLYVSAGYNERLPTTSERYGFYLFNRMDNRDYIGNPLLKNEQAWNAELNLLFARDNLSWKLTGFGSRVQQYIMGKTEPGLSVMTPGALGVRAYKNIPFANIYGAESNLNYRFAGQHFILNSTLKWVSAQDNQGEPLPQIPPLKAITSLRFTHHMLFVQAENELSLKQNRINFDFGESETPGYTLFNLRLGYTFEMKGYKLDFSMGAENLLNQAYTEHLDWGRLLRPGRNIYTMLTLRF
uniref:TonB-dependent receptor n=1 Tax=Pedobacter schmidteae TaxID=2201271 RepID=UPI000EB00377|nr:TonB-dependent receptor [Pedobacter schmidteae]